MLAARHGHGRVPNTMSTHIRLVRAHAFDDAARPSVFHWCLVVSRFQWHNSSGVARILSGIGFPTWAEADARRALPSASASLGCPSTSLEVSVFCAAREHNASDLDAMHIGLRNLQTCPCLKRPGATTLCGPTVILGSAMFLLFSM